MTIDPGDSQRVHDVLIERGFVVDHRPGAGIRVGPHFYNTAGRGAALVDPMQAELRATGEGGAGGGPSSTVRSGRADPRPAPPGGRRSRGRQNMLDMVRSLGLVLLVIGLIAAFFTRNPDATPPADGEVGIGGLGGRGGPVPGPGRRRPARRLDRDVEPAQP